MSQCPGAELLEQLMAGKALPPSVVAHVESCRSCQAVIDEMRADEAVLEEWWEAEHGRGQERPGGSLTDEAPAEQSVDADAAHRNPQVRVLGYEVLGEIGRGAQGVVYEAIQMATRRRVALKLLLHGASAGDRQRRRFEREVEAVAALRHPGIVTLYESGRTPAGDLYLAMERIEGRPLDEQWARRAQDEGVGAREAMTLFREICQAIRHAHQRGVIHRDLKPSNILVDEEGLPRVVDFGLARAQREVGALGTTELCFAGTFAYAAPEQIAKPLESVDVRVDVYALGAILSELLLGRRPFAECETIPELVRRKSLPVTPQALRMIVDGRPRLDRDVATIVAKAMAVEPERRYQSAAELLEDVERWLAGRPISARQDSLLYVLLSAARRHPRLSVAFTSLAVLFAALLAVLATTMVRLERQRDDALDTLQVFRESLAATDPLAARAAQNGIAGFLHDVARHVELHLDDQPEVAGPIRSTLGQIAINNASYGDARQHLERALGLAQRSKDALLEAEVIHSLGRVEFFQGRYQEAANLYQDALERRRRLLGESHPETVTTGSHLASCLRRLGRIVEAEQLLRGALAARLAGPRDRLEVAAAWNNLGSLLQDTGRAEEALAIFDRVCILLRSSAGQRDWRLAHALRNRAACLIELGELTEAKLALAESEDLWASAVQPDHPALSAVRHLQARLALEGGRVDDASLLAEQALASRGASLGTDHPDVAETLRLLGMIRLAQHRPDEAQEHLASALDIRRRSLPPDHWAIAESTGDLGALLAEAGAVEAARPLLLESWLIWQRHADFSPERMVEATERMKELPGSSKAVGPSNLRWPIPYPEHP